MASEHADSSALESNDLAGLASFLSDTPDTEPEQEDAEANTVEESTAEGDTEDATDDGQDVDPEAPDADEEETAPVEAKITFKVKNDDGSEETVEATTEEIAKSYMRQAAFTRKTQELAERESKAVELLHSKFEENRSQYLAQAELTRAAIIQMAAIKSESELAQLANSDPAAWVAEQQRQKQIGAYLSQLDQQINGEKQQAELQKSQQFQQHLQQQYAKAWDELSKDKIDKPQLQSIYGAASKNYGFSNEELANVYDARLVRMMRDAAAYKDLQSKRPAVTKQIEKAPQLPSRQAKPTERVDKALDNRFKTGRAKLNDLAAFLR